ncbi:unnamed protein product, partial [Prorocentrum cordatum]
MANVHQSARFTQGRSPAEVVQPGRPSVCALDRSLVLRALLDAGPRPAPAALAALVPWVYAPAVVGFWANGGRPYGELGLRRASSAGAGAAADPAAPGAPGAGAEQIDDVAPPRPLAAHEFLLWEHMPDLRVVKAPCRSPAEENSWASRAALPRGRGRAAVLQHLPRGYARRSAGPPSSMRAPLPQHLHHALAAGAGRLPAGQ